MHRAEDQTGVGFAGGDQRTFDVVVNRRFARGAEARAHVHAVGAQRQRSGHPATVADST